MAKLGEYGKLLPFMSREDVWELGIAHLRMQGEKSQKRQTTKDNFPIATICRYEGPNGLCCAAAPFIPEFDQDMEGKSWSQLVILGEVVDIHREVLESLQNLHDKFPVLQWLSRGRIIAESSKLPTKIFDVEKEDLPAFVNSKLSEIEHRR